MGVASASVFRVNAGLLIPGRGAPVADAAVVVDGAVIVYAGPQAGAPQVSSAPISVPVLMPGMWECHGHFTGERGSDLAALATMHPALMGARAGVDAGTVLRAGFTSVRDVGGIGVHLRRGGG